MTCFPTELTEIQDFVLITAFSRDGKWMLSGSKDRCVVFWDIELGTLHHIISGHKNTVMRVVTSPVEDVFATASGDMTVRL
jgi:glucose repression regulatory protein TUP1